MVEEFLKFQLSVDRRPADALLERIRSSYCSIIGVKDHRNIVKSVDVIEELAKTLLPPDVKDDTEYLFNAKAIVLFFFEACEYGAKTEIETSLGTFFDNNINHQE